MRRVIFGFSAGVAVAASAQTVVPPPMALPDDAALRASVASWKPVAQGVLIPANSPVRLRLSPTLGDGMAAVQAMVATRRGVEIAEPADYVLETDADFPQTVRLTPVEDFAAEDGTAAQKARAIALPSTELGNLMLDDYAPAFDRAIRRIAFARALMAVGSAGARSTVTCMTDHPSSPDATACDAGGEFVPVGKYPRLLSMSPTPTYFAVRNDTVTPRYLYLIDIGPLLDISVVMSAAGAPVRAGDWVRSEDGRILSGGGHVLVTIASDRPLPAETLRDPGALRCAGSPPCGLADGDASSSSSWAATATFFYRARYEVPRIGGGRDAGSRMAGWMAEFYSTVPYTIAEFAADDAKPAGEKEFLRARAGPGLYHRCGGTLIAPDLMLTAAHCVAKGGFAGDAAVRVFRERRVRTGSQMLGRAGTTWAIDAMVVHAGYRAGMQPDDIALVHLKADRAALGAEPPSALARLPGAVPLDAGAPVTAFGWGFTGQVAPGARALVDTGGRVQRNPDRLQYGELQALGWATCRRRVGALLDAGMLCAETRRSGAFVPRGKMNVFSCVGDSGGPLVREDRAGDVLVGIASWSKGCGYGDNPSVYTSVARFAGWIANARKRMTAGRVVYLDDRGAARVVGAAAASPRP